MKSIVDQLVGELLKNRLLALRYDKDNLMNEVVHRMKQTEKEQIIELLKFCHTMFTKDAPMEYVISEFEKLSQKENQKKLIIEIMEKDEADGLYDYPELEGTINLCKDRIDKLKQDQELAESLWEGCDGCNENDKNFWINGFISGLRHERP
jgi:galactose-1-phosphate uridylyltransferase